MNTHTQAVYEVMTINAHRWRQARQGVTINASDRVPGLLRDWSEGQLADELSGLDLNKVDFKALQDMLLEDVEKLGKGY